MDDDIKNKKNEDVPEEDSFPEELSDEVEAQEYQKLLGEVSEYKDKYLRLLAEFENARKRMERDKLDFLKYANEGLIVQFLDILDDLGRTVRAAEEKHQDYEAFLKGVEMVMGRIDAMLKKNNVKPMDAQGKMFDPNYHEPLLQEESTDAKEGTVLEELQKGYFYHDRVVRTAKVKLAKKPDDNKNNNAQKDQ